MTPRIGSACTGYGGLDMAVQTVFGGELAWWADVEPGPIAVMERHHPGVPNVHDIKTAAPLYPHLPRVDILTAGYPCQPFSNAGLRLGTEDPRHLWPYVAEAVGALRPGLVVLENVAAHLRRGFDVVLADLAGLGYDAVWTVVRASDVGAPHQRKRLFVLATDATGSFGRGRGVGLEARDTAERGRPDLGRCDPIADSADDGHTAPGAGGRQPEVAAAVSYRATTADTVRERLDGHPQFDGQPRTGQDGERGHDFDRRVGVDFGPYQAAIERWAGILGRPAPDPTTTGQRGARVLNPVFVEWMMGLPAGHVTDTEGLSRNAMLKLLGNGVVPQQAEYALRQLVATMTAIDGLVAA